MDTEFAIDFFLSDKYTSPVSECSLYKGIPIKFRHHPVVESFLSNGSYRVRYRGPRYDFQALSCIKSNAKTFAIYKR